MKFIILSALLFMVITCYAQQPASDFSYFQKGRNILGARLFGGFSEDVQNKKFDFSVKGASLRYGRFIKNKIAVGADVIYLRNGVYYNKIGIQPFGRYYFLEKKFTPFVETIHTFAYHTFSNGVANESNNQTWHAQIHNFFAGGGLAFTGIFKYFGAEIYAGYNYGFQKVTNNPFWGNYSGSSHGSAMVGESIFIFNTSL